MRMMLLGLRVVSLATNLPGPLAAARLVSMGATVTKVEPPAGDPLKAVAPGWYSDLVAGQQVVTLDLKDPEGREALEDLLDEADVLLVSMRHAAVERLGLVEMAEEFRIGFVEIVGHAGERADEAGHDLTYQAAHGTLDPPHLPRVPVADLLGAERAFTAVLLAQRERERGESAPRMRVVLDDAAHDAAAAVRHRLTGPGTVLGGGLPSYDIYASADGHVAVAALEPHFAERLATVVGRTREELTAAFTTRTGAEWEAVASEHDIPIVVVRQAR